jgi:hypothetical protein
VTFYVHMYSMHQSRSFLRCRCSIKFTFVPSIVDMQLYCNCNSGFINNWIVIIIIIIVIVLQSVLFYIRGRCSIKFKFHPSIAMQWKIICDESMMIAIRQVSPTHTITWQNGCTTILHDFNGVASWWQCSLT